MAHPTSQEWLTTVQMAGRLKVHPKTLLRLRAASFTPFVEGRDYRRAGLTTRAPLQWHAALCEAAFTSFTRVDPAAVEAFSRAGA